MIKLLFYCLIFVIAIFIGLWISADPGYVLIAYRHWTVETPLWFFVVALFVLIIILHYGFGIWDMIQNMLARRRYKRHWANFYKITTLTNQGLLAALGANWSRAEKLLLKSTKKSQEPLINYLALAYVMQMQEKTDKSTMYLEKAKEASPVDQFAVDLMQAQLQLSQNDFKAAIATLKHLQDAMPKNAFVLRLLKKAYVALEDWASLENLLPALRKVLPKNEYREIEDDVRFH